MNNDHCRLSSLGMDTVVELGVPSFTGAEHLWKGKEEGGVGKETQTTLQS